MVSQSSFPRKCASSQNSSGPWSKEETTQLVDIMAEYNYEKPQGEDQDVFWRQVSHRMDGSRSIAQIRTKWRVA